MAPRNDVPERALRNGMLERAPKNGISEGASKNGVLEGIPRNGVPEGASKNGVSERAPYVAVESVIFHQLPTTVLCKTGFPLEDIFKRFSPHSQIHCGLALLYLVERHTPISNEQSL
jgi:hypothetical protein